MEKGKRMENEMFRVAYERKGKRNTERLGK